MSRETNEVIRQAEAAIENAKYSLRVARNLGYLSVFLLVVSVLLGVLSLGREVKGALFGNSHTFRFGGLHSPLRTRADFETEFTKRLIERGFQVDSIHVSRETSLHQFYGEVTVINVPNSVSSNDVLGVLREVGNSLEDKQLPVEK